MTTTINYLDESNECVICFEKMYGGYDKLSKCLYCNNQIHTKCHITWLRRGLPLKKEICFYCQRSENTIYIKQPRTCGARIIKYFTSCFFIKATK